MSFALRLATLASLGLAFVGYAQADDLQSYAITMKDHKITPAEIHVPSGKPFYVLVTNNTGTADEFEMLFPALEQVIQPGDTRKVFIRPLKAGHFPFMGENDPDGERGFFVAE
ncbi:MAG: cupredoxin domain-containing protein [Hyphomicrobiales bacterium]|nr:cupredoxin domain-containing protein [Hyphomicrobiales bacterium]MBV8664029.1 cupredoxin domain-containing protein [Hyphomicrobiales bacterium]